MPTASTAQILGNNECFEPYTNNLYKRNVLSGEFVVVNRHLVEDLIQLDLWNDNIRLKMIKNNGSIQTIAEIPFNIKQVYKTVWEMKASNLIDMSADRAVFIDQSQSMNLFIRDANVAKLNKALFYGWKKGLKTGMYYLRSNAKSEARKSLGADVNSIKEKEEKETSMIEVEVMVPKVNEFQKNDIGNVGEDAYKNVNVIQKVAEQPIKASAEISQEEIDAMSQLQCSIDNPDDCIQCGS